VNAITALLPPRLLLETMGKSGPPSAAPSSAAPSSAAAAAAAASASVPAVPRPPLLPSLSGSPRPLPLWRLPCGLDGGGVVAGHVWTSRCELQL